ncbi:MAG: UDP-glucose/GDP-mannose dehydrogenase family protein [Acidimicrobiales bacterium]
MGEKIAVIGAGYVGLTSGACFAHLGHDVVCADIDAERVARLSRGDIHIREDRLDHLVREGLAAQRLRFVVGSAGAVTDADFVCLCVSTPMSDSGAADLSALDAVTAEIGPALRPGTVVMIKSTVPVGTGRRVRENLGRTDVHVVSTPEFLREGLAVRDFLEPDRIVIGADEPQVADRVATLFRRVTAPVVLTDHVSAELTKYAANAFLALKLSYINEIANLCELVGADIGDVARGIGHDPRIGRTHLSPGPGWGGSCLPKDVRALVHAAEEVGHDFTLLREAVTVNEHQFAVMADKVRDAVGGDLSGVKVGALGLAFKAGTNDLRDSPALAVLDLLAEAGASIRAYDPAIAAVDDERITVVADAYAACEGADVVVVLTEWDDFTRLDLDRIAAVVNRRVLVDTRNLLDPEPLVRRGFSVVGVGGAGTADR